MAAAIIGKSSRSKARWRAKSNVNAPQRTNPIKITNVAFVGSVATVTFDQPVALSGVPQYTSDLAPTPVSAAMTSPTTVAITYSGAVATATALNVPYEEPAVRNASGGFVSTSSVVV